MKYFVDENGIAWSVKPNGETNHPSEIKVHGDTVTVISEFISRGSFTVNPELKALGVTSMKYKKMDEDQNRDYPLYDSLTALAMATEQSPAPSEDGSVSLEQAVADAHQQAESFRKHWLENNAKEPEFFPMVLPVDNAGLWHEQITGHDLEQ